MKTREIPLVDIIVDDNLNVREKLDEETVERYMECFEQLPPAVVVETAEGYLLADGFHRVEAAKRLGRTDIDADVREGTRKDAEEYAALANLRHGKPLTRAERRKAVERMLILHPEWSDRKIAQEMGVSHHTVRSHRKELESTGQIAQLAKLIGRDGKERPREVPHPKQAEQVSDKAQETEVEPIEQVDTETPEQETPSSTVVEVEGVEDDTTEELKVELSDEVIPQDDDNGTQADIQELEAVAPEPTTQVVSRRPAKLPDDAPEGWGTFAEYRQWIEDYSFTLLKEDIHYARRAHRSLEVLVTQLEEALEELDESP